MKRPRNLPMKLTLRAMIWEISLMIKLRAVRLTRLPMLFFISFFIHFCTWFLITYWLESSSLIRSSEVMMICSSRMFMTFSYCKESLMEDSGSRNSSLSFIFFPLLASPATGGSYIFFHPFLSISFEMLLLSFRQETSSEVRPSFILRAQLLISILSSSFSKITPISCSFSKIMKICCGIIVSSRFSELCPNPFKLHVDTFSFSIVQNTWMGISTCGFSMPGPITPRSAFRYRFVRFRQRQRASSASLLRLLLLTPEKSMPVVLMKSKSLPLPMRTITFSTMMDSKQIKLSGVASYTIGLDFKIYPSFLFKLIFSWQTATPLDRSSTSNSSLSIPIIRIFSLSSSDTNSSTVSSQKSSPSQIYSMLSPKLFCKWCLTTCSR